jgi:hypothetical protein
MFNREMWFIVDGRILDCLFMVADPIRVALRPLILRCHPSS